MPQPSIKDLFREMYPYREKLATYDHLPKEGRPQDEMRLHGDEICGAITSGGSESIMLPMLAYRNKAYAERGVTAPEMVVPDTIRPAFSKGAFYLGVKLIRVLVGSDYLSQKGWRLNGLQRPPGFHMCVTLPQTIPGVAYAKTPGIPPARSGAAYGGPASSILGPYTPRQLMYARMDAAYEL